MFSKVKRLLAPVLCLVLLFALTACSSNDKKETTKSEGTKTEANKTNDKKNEDKKAVTISYAIPSSQANNEAITNAIEAWETKTGNKIDLQSIPDDQYDSVVKARIAGGDGIDIFKGPFQVHDVENTMVELSDEAFVDRISEPVLDSLMFDGKVYGFPGAEGVSSFGFFYNKDAFEKAGITNVPTTFEEFDKVCSTLKEKGINPIFISGKDGWTLLQHRNAVSGAIYQENNKVWEQLNNNEIKWTDINEFKVQYEALANWAKKEYINERFLTATYEEAMNEVATGTSAMLLNGSWVVAGILGYNADANIGFIPLPTSKGTPSIPVSGYGGGYHIAKTSKYVDTAKDFLRFVIDPENVVAYIKNAPGIVAYNDVQEIEGLPKVFDEIKAYIEKGQNAPHGDTKYIVPMNNNEIIAIYQELLAGRISVDEFIETHHKSYESNAKAANIPNF